MTAPRADGADRTLGARRGRGARTAIGSLAVLLLVGLLLRLTIAYVLLPGSGFESDIGTFTSWALRLGANGPSTFYANAGFADYPPGYLYVLWLVGGLGSVLAPFAHGDAGAATAALIKLPPIFLDIAVGALLYYLVTRWRANRPDAARLGLIAAALYVLNPVTWYDSAVWGQVDATGAAIAFRLFAMCLHQPLEDDDHAGILDREEGLGSGGFHEVGQFHVMAKARMTAASVSSPRPMVKNSSARTS